MMQKWTKQSILDNIKANKPVALSYNDISILPVRGDFIDPTLHVENMSLIDRREPISFLPNTVEEDSEYTGEYNGSKYAISIYGIWTCGQKACVRLVDVPIYVDVRTDRYDEKHLKCKLDEFKIKYTHIEPIKAKPLFEFAPDLVSHHRCYFKTLKTRREFIDKTKHLYELSSNDLGKPGTYWYSVIARTHLFKTADWNTVSNYTVATGTKVPTIEVKLVGYTKVPRSIRSTNNNMLYDRTLLGSWDTEVHNMSINGGVATPEDNYDVFIINTSFFWHHSSEPIVNFCCVSVPMIPKEDAEVSNVVYIVCKTEKEALLANMYVLANMLPDILTAYNSTGFDWPIIREHMKRHCILKLFADSINIHERKYGKDQSPDDVYKWTFSGEKVKINAERTMELTCVAHIPGMLDIDAMVYITQLYPKTEVGRGKSLNYFLTANKLPLKEDMPYETMRKIYVQAKHNAETNGRCSILLRYGLYCSPTSDGKTDYCWRQEITGIHGLYVPL
jgi:hypothetical protein